MGLIGQYDKAIGAKETHFKNGALVYISKDILLNKYSVLRDTIRKGLSRFSSGKSKGWEHILDKNGNVQINVNSIPKRTRTAYNIPTSEVLTELKALGKVALFDNSINDVDKEVLAIDFVNEMYKNELARPLLEAFNNGYSDYFKIVKNEIGHRPERIKSVCSTLAFFEKCIELMGTGKRAKKGTVKKIFEVYQELDTYNNITRYNHFTEFAKRLRQEPDLLIEFVLHANRHNTNNLKLTPYHKALVLFYVSLPNQLTYDTVKLLVNHHISEAHQQLKIISESTIKKMMRKNENKGLIASTRYGSKYFDSQFGSYQKRSVSPFPSTTWMMDGTPIQFYCYNEDRTKIIRLNLFVVIDVCTRKVVGYSISLSEDRYAVMNALQMACNICGHLPNEIVSDNFSAGTSQEMKAIESEFNKMGITWRRARVHNAKDKTYVERFFATFQSVVCRFYDHYLGEGITSKRLNGRPSKEFLNAVWKKQKHPSYNNMFGLVTEMIVRYNDLSIRGRKSPSQVFAELPKVNAVTLETYQIAVLFWKTREVKASRSKVIFEYKTRKYTYLIYDYDDRLKYGNVQVRVRYDEKELDSIYLYDVVTDDFICECKREKVVPVAKCEQSKDDEKEIIKRQAREKGFKNYIAKKRKQVMEDGLKSVGETLEGFEIVDPLNLQKGIQNKIESDQMRNYILDRESISKKDLDQYKRTPLKSDFLKDKEKAKKKALKAKKQRYNSIEAL